MIETNIRICMGIIRRIFTCFIGNQIRNSFYTFTVYANMTFITLYGFINDQWKELYDSTVYFKKFFSDDWVKCHDYR
jgi:hypothetical protein